MGGSTLTYKDCVFPLPNNSINVNEIFRIVNRNVSSNKSSKCEVDKEPYLLRLREKNPYLSKYYNIYNWPNGIGIHIDTGRTCALNIPISSELSETIVYNWVEYPLDSDNSKFPYLRLIDEKHVSEAFRFSLTKPCIFNTIHPHSVVNHTEHNRIVFSWSIPNISFKELTSEWHTNFNL